MQDATRQCQAQVSKTSMSAPSRAQALSSRWLRPVPFLHLAAGDDTRCAVARSTALALGIPTTTTFHNLY